MVQFLVTIDAQDENGDKVDEHGIQEGIEDFYGVINLRVERNENTIVQIVSALDEINEKFGLPPFKKIDTANSLEEIERDDLIRALKVALDGIEQIEQIVKYEEGL